MRNINFKKFQNGPKNFLLLLCILALGVLVLTKLTDLTRFRKSLTYSEFLKNVEADKVKSVSVVGQEAMGILKDGTHFETVIADNPKNWDLLRDHGVEFAIALPSTSLNFWQLILILALISIPIAIWAFFRKIQSTQQGGGGNIFSMGKSKAKMYLPSQIKVNFKSVAGAVEAKEELMDVVDYLKNPSKYQKLGAKLTRGVLLIGEPGNGKTLLAKAVAGEANCPFFSISGSDFIEVFVGVGAARVRDLFAEARKRSPCIIFIDEIDAVGRQRSSTGIGGGHDEREQTLNQLLSEMDGFESSNVPVVVIGATNRADVLDKALLRPGRFDRQVYVPYPDLKSRESILKVSSEGVKISPDLDYHKIARATPGFTGADLANLINEAAINASKLNKTEVTMHDVEEARDKMIMGKALKSTVLSEKERKIIAFHEAGHAMVRLMTPEDSEPLHKITIVPRGKSLGATHWLPESDKYLRQKDEIIADITSALGGRAAEEIVFNEISSGASDDFSKATAMARQMVCTYGMSEKLGQISIKSDEAAPHYSQSTLQLIDQEVKSIIDKAYEHALSILKSNRESLDKLAQELLEKETLDAEEVYALLGIQARVIHKLV